MELGLSFPLFRRSVVGIDIGNASIKVVRLEGSSRSVRLSYAGFAELTKEGSEDKVEDMLKSLLDEGGIRKERIGAVFTGYTPTIRYLTLPKMPKDELSEAVKWETGKIINLPLEGMIIDFLIMGEIDDRDIRKYEILIVAVEKNTVFGNMALFKKIGIQISFLTVNPLSLLNIVKRNYKSYEGNIVYVDIGAGKMDINISKKGVLKFTRNIHMGGSNISKAIEERENISFNEAESLKKERGVRAPLTLQATEAGEANIQEKSGEAIKAIIDNFILEIQRSIDFYRAQFREGAIERIILSGGAVLMPNLKDYLTTFFDAPVVIDNPFFNIAYNKETFRSMEGITPRFSTAAGTALGLLR